MATSYNLSTRGILGLIAASIAILLLAYRREIPKAHVSSEDALLASFFAGLSAIVIREYWHGLPAILAGGVVAGMFFIRSGASPYGVLLGLSVAAAAVALVPVAKKRLLS
jgi:hypothetical protein